MNSKRNYFVLIVAVLSFGLLLTGGTYAWLYYDSVNVVGNGLNANTTCFLIDYSGDFNPFLGDINGNGKVDIGDIMLVSGHIDGEEILTGEDFLHADMNKDGIVNETDLNLIEDLVGYSTIYHNTFLFPSNTDRGGLSGSVTMGISGSCKNISGVGKLTLKVDSTVVDSSRLTDGALRYSVYKDNDEKSIPDKSGVISSWNIDIYDNIELSQTPATFYVYVWLDGNDSDVDNSYLDFNFSARIHASATQVES